MTRALFTTINSSPLRRSGDERKSESTPALFLPRQVEHSRSIPLWERLLGDVFRRKVELEFGKELGEWRDYKAFLERSANRCLQAVCKPLN